MALRAGYKGFKKLAPGLKLRRPGTIAIDNDVLSETFFTRSEHALYGAFNILPIYSESKTSQGVVYTLGPDDVLTISNQATGYSYFGYTARNDRQFKIPVGSWKIIPRKTGTDDSYIIMGAGNTPDGTGGTFEEWASTNGGPVTFTVDETKSNRYVSFSVVVEEGKTANSTWQPMIVPADTPDNFPYVPYAMTNKQLTDYDIEEDITEDFFGTFPENVSLGTNSSIFKKGNLIIGNIVVKKTDGFAQNTDVLIPITEKYRPKVDINSYSVIQSSEWTSEGTIGYLYIQNNMAIRNYSTPMNFAKIQFMYVSKAATAANRSLPEATREAAPEDVTPEEKTVKKTTRKKSTAKADTEKEGE